MVEGLYSYNNVSEIDHTDKKGSPDDRGTILKQRFAAISNMVFYRFDKLYC